MPPEYVFTGRRAASSSDELLKHFVGPVRGNPPVQTQQPTLDDQVLTAA